MDFGKVEKTFKSEFVCAAKKSANASVVNVVVVGVVVKLRKLRDALDLNLRSGDFATRSGRSSGVTDRGRSRWTRISQMTGPISHGKELPSQGEYLMRLLLREEQEE